jgi:DNA-binding transcriptional regulator YhcF (GntR family)
MTTFNSDRAIYLQMADNICDRIIAGEFKADERIPSVRELAVELGVNINTAVSAYDQLARAGIVYNRRGLGYFVAQGARDLIVARRRAEFMDKTLPEVSRQMRLLHIGVDEVTRRLSELGQHDKTEKP